jgi:hypothetical protein
VPYWPAPSGSLPPPQGQWSPQAPGVAGAAGPRLVARSSAQRDRVSSSLRPSSPAAAANPAAAYPAAAAAAAAAVIWPSSPPSAAPPPAAASSWPSSPPAASASVPPAAGPPLGQLQGNVEARYPRQQESRPPALSAQELAAHHTFRYDRRTEQVSSEEQQQVRHGAACELLWDADSCWCLCVVTRYA